MYNLAHVTKTQSRDLKYILCPAVLLRDNTIFTPFVSESLQYERIFHLPFIAYICYGYGLTYTACTKL